MNCDFDPTIHPHPRRKIQCPRCGLEVITGVDHFPAERTKTMERMLSFTDTRPRPEDYKTIAEHTEALRIYTHHFDQYIIAITFNRSYNHIGGKYGKRNA